MVVTVYFVLVLGNLSDLGHTRLKKPVLQACVQVINFNKQVAYKSVITHLCKWQDGCTDLY